MAHAIAVGVLSTDIGESITVFVLVSIKIVYPNLLEALKS
jgi:hypothetical protein